MATFQVTRSRFTPRMRAWVAIVVLLLVCFVLARGVWGIYQKNRIAEENKDAALRRLAEIEARQQKAETKLTKIKTKQGLEKEIRQSLPVAKEGEYVINIIDDQTAVPGGEEVASSGPKAGFWAALLRGL